VECGVYRIDVVEAAIQGAFFRADGRASVREPRRSVSITDSDHRGAVGWHPHAEHGDELAGAVRQGRVMLGQLPPPLAARHDSGITAGKEDEVYTCRVMCYWGKFGSFVFAK
jgi:hypothetical protein